MRAFDPREAVADGAIDGPCLAAFMVVTAVRAAAHPVKRAKTLSAVALPSRKSAGLADRTLRPANMELRVFPLLHKNEINYDTPASGGLIAEYAEAVQKSDLNVNGRLDP